MKLFSSILFSLIIGFTFANDSTISVLDLSEKDLNTETQTLDGEWLFSWNTDYADFTPQKRIKVPGFWNSDKSIPTFGQACYRTTIKVPKITKRLALKIHNIHNSYELWINGELVHRNGKTSLKKEEQVADWSPFLVPLDLDTNQFEITFVIANYGHRNSGFASSIYIGEYKKMLKEREFYMSIDALIIGGLFVLGLFLFSMYLMWKHDNSLLYFLGFSMSFGLWTSFRDEKVFFSIWNGFDWELALRIEYASLIIAVSFFVVFISRLFPKQNIKPIQKLVISANSVSLLIILFFPPHIFTFLSISNIVTLLILIIYVFYVFYKANVSHEFNNIFTTISLSLLILLIVLQIFNFLGIYAINRTIVNLTTLSFVLSMSLIFASRFSDIFNSTVTLKEKAERQQFDLEVKNNEITASIQYAKQLQSTILPTREEITEIFKNYFIYYQPKDIVSGDFYWMEEHNGIVHFAVADCTGHGVPGAMVSFVCSNVLSQIVLDENITSPEKILDRARELVIRRFSTSETSLNDGMDISIGSFDANTNILSWAGANNPLYIVRQQTTEVIEIKGNKQPIGKYAAEEKPFTVHQFSMQKGDRIYLFSDGYIDQFGGPKGKKFKTKQFKDLILEMQQEPLSEQQKRLETTFNNWKGEKFQIDDVSVCGLEF